MEPTEVPMPLPTQVGEPVLLRIHVRPRKRVRCEVVAVDGKALTLQVPLDHTSPPPAALADLGIVVDEEGVGHLEGALPGIGIGQWRYPPGR